MGDHTLWPSILPGEDFVDDSYSREELERMEWDELRGIAARHETDAVNGRSDREEIEDVLEGKQRL
jgi:hypothetical protein